MNKLQSILGFALLCILFSCNTYFNQPLKVREAKVGETTPKTKLFRDLPSPEAPIVVAVYKFRDQTGQYKLTEYGSSWSTVVTQGATSILIKALEESNWFIPIERESLSNLLNERKIVRSSRASSEQQAGDSGGDLPPMLFAGIILEGGIISYDYNILTGGIGARYLGIGGNVDYREDRISIYLRAVSTNSGRILKSIYTTKSILSQQINGSIFKYVKPTSLFEFETGFTYNEPTDIAVKEAIEKAVQDLIIEGTMDGIWKLKEPNRIQDTIFSNYIAEKEGVMQSNFWGNPVKEFHRNWALGLAADAMVFRSDYGNNNLTYGLSNNGKYFFKSGLFLGYDFGYGELKARQYFKSQFLNLGLNAGYMFLPKRSFSPYFMLGIGSTLNNNTTPYLKGAVGFELFLGERSSFFVEASSNYLANDRYDNFVGGEFNDYFWGVKIGVNFYMNLTRAAKK